MSKYLYITHPVGILESAQILDEKPRLFFFRVVEAECRRQNLRDLLSRNEYDSSRNRDRQSTLRMLYKTLSFIYSSANRAYTILRIF